MALVLNIHGGEGIRNELAEYSEYLKDTVALRGKGND